MYAPIHAGTRSSLSVPRNVRGYERRRYDDGDGAGRGAAEETKIGPRFLERTGYQK